jgi:peptidyl-prolyl cis-trans isomerase B (cyclophilin B)
MRQPALLLALTAVMSVSALRGPAAAAPPAREGRQATPARQEEPILTPGVYARFSTTEGAFVVRLFDEQAPKTVANFVDLAEGRKDPATGKPATVKPFYDGLIFHRVIDGFMIQGGDPLGTGRGGPGYTFSDEIDPGLVFDRAGLLAMANRGPNTNGSQFFITHGATPWLDGKHSVFGEVLGADDQRVVDAIRQGDAIESIVVEGDVDALLAEQSDRVADWNKALETRG